MKSTFQPAFIWIIGILKSMNIPFQISGGLAAISYGASRELVDIDIDIPEEYFPLVKTKVAPFIIYGPGRYIDEAWDLMLMTLNYHGQAIDLGGAYQTKILNHQSGQWQDLPADFSRCVMKKIADLSVPVIEKEELIFYKKIIARPVDLLDVAQMLET